MPQAPSRTYAFVAASTNSVVTSSISSFLPPSLPAPLTTASLPPIDEDAFPTLGSGGAGLPLRRRRHWRSAEGRRREPEEGEAVVVEQPPDLPPRPSPSIPPPYSSLEQSSLSVAYAPPTPPSSQNINAQRSSFSPPSAPSAQLQQALTQLPIPPRPPLPQSPPTSFTPLPSNHTLSRRPLNDSERAHLLQVLDVSRDALRRLEQRDQSREGRIGYLRSQIDAMEALLRGGGEAEEESSSTRAGERRLDQVNEDGEEAESMLPHSLLTGQMSLLRRRGAIHRNVPNPPLQLPPTDTFQYSGVLPPHPQLPPSSLPSSNALPPLQNPTTSTESHQQRVRTASRIRTSPLRSLSGDSNRTSPPVDDPSIPPRLRPSHIQLLSQQFAEAGRQWPTAPRAQREGVHRPVPGKPGGSDAKVDEGGSWRLWCRAPSRRGTTTTKKRVGKHFQLGPPPEWLEGDGSGGGSKGSKEEGCGALVVSEGAVRSPGGLRFESQVAPVGAGKWGRWKEEEVKELEGEMGSLGCACEKRLVLCFNCGRIIGTYIDASQPYHTHPIYTYAATRVASRFVPSPPSASKQPTTTSSSSSRPQAPTHSLYSHPPSNSRPLFLPVSATERSFYSQLNRSSNPLQRVSSETDSEDSLPDIVPVTRQSRLPDDLSLARLRPQNDLSDFRRRGLSREEANGWIQAIRLDLAGSQPSTRDENEVETPGRRRLRPPMVPYEFSDTDSEDLPGELPLATVVAQTLQQRPGRFQPSTIPSSQPPTQTRNPPLPPSSEGSSSSFLDSEDSLPILRRSTNSDHTSRDADGGHRNSSILNSLSASVLIGETRESPYLVTGPPLLSSAALVTMVERSNERLEQQERVRDCLDLESLRAARTRVLGSRRRREEEEEEREGGGRRIDAAGGGRMVGR